MANPDGVTLQEAYNVTSPNPGNIITINPTTGYKPVLLRGDTGSYLKQGILAIGNAAADSKILYISPSSSSSDNANAIKNAIDAVNGAGGGVVYLLSGLWTINQSIPLKSKVSIIGEGPTIPEIRRDSSWQGHFFTSTDNLESVLIANLVLDGYDPEIGTEINGINIQSAAGKQAKFCRFVGLEIRNFSGSGIYIEGTSAYKALRNLISSCVIGESDPGASSPRKVKKWGVFCKYNSEVTVENTLVSHSGDSGIRLLASERAKISGNIVRKHTAGWGIIVEGESSANYQSDVLVQHNHVWDSGDNAGGILGKYMNNVNILGNICRENGYSGISVDSCKDVEIESNIAPNQTNSGAGQGIKVVGCDRVIVQSNIV